jgi:hypothetical protein
MRVDAGYDMGVDARDDMGINAGYDVRVYARDDMGINAGNDVRVHARDYQVKGGQFRSDHDHTERCHDQGSEAYQGYGLNFHTSSPFYIN